MDTNREEDLIAEGGEEEVSEAGEGGMNELSPVDHGMEDMGEGQKQRKTAPSHLRAQDFACGLRRPQSAQLTADPRQAGTGLRR
jgi:hypothetical protein